MKPAPGYSGGYLTYPLPSLSLNPKGLEQFKTIITYLPKCTVHDCDIISV